jgi:DNA-binding CsgD family transcriptional regulator
VDDDLADLTWAWTCPPWMPPDGLSASQRLLLGMVLFGPVTYQQAADRTGLTPAQVSQLCAAALRQLAVAKRPADGALGV